MPRKLENLVGQIFGSLSVEEYAGLICVGKQKQSSWLCKCECGKTITVLNNNLKRGNTKSCGCYRIKQTKKANIKDISGEKFGLILVIEYFETRNKNAYWKCKCDCGNIAFISSCALKSGQISCGCKQGNFTHGEWSKGQANYAKFRRSDPIRKLKHNVSCSIRSAIKSRNKSKAGEITFEKLPYTPEQLKAHLESLFEPWMDWDNYGGKSNDPRKTWQIDHIKPHSSFLYKSLNDESFLECWSLSNLRPLEKKENASKGDSQILNQAGLF